MLDPNLSVTLARHRIILLFFRDPLLLRVGYFAHCQVSYAVIDVPFVPYGSQFALIAPSVVTTALGVSSVLERDCTLYAH